MSLRKSTTKPAAERRRETPPISHLIAELRAAQARASVKTNIAFSDPRRDKEEQRTYRLAMNIERAYWDVGAHECRDLEELRRKLDVFFEALKEAGQDTCDEMARRTQADCARLLRAA